MAKRRDFQSAHENAVITSFISWYNEENETSYQIVKQPDPPDAILHDPDSDEYTWVEATDAFFSGEWARDEYSHANPDETDYDMQSSQVDIDNRHAEMFVEIVKQKLAKTSYNDAVASYGEGILVVAMLSPWFNNQTYEAMAEKWDSEDVENEAGSIGEIYICWRSNGDYDFCRWELL